MGKSLTGPSARLSLLVLAGACTLAACGGRAVVDELAPISVDVDEDLVEPPPLRVEWTVAAAQAAPAPEPGADPAAPTHGPAVDANHVYLPYDDVVRALRVADGTVAWTAHLPGAVLATPVVIGTGIAVATEAAWLFFDTDGRARGLLPVTAPPREAAAIGDRLVFTDGADVHTARLPGPEETAALVWSVPAPGAAGLRPGPAGRLVVVAAAEAGVVALDLATGAVRWHREDLPVIRVRPAIGPRRAFVVGADSRIRALELSDGDVDWTSKAVGVRVSGAPVMVDGIVWVPGLDAALYGFDADGGSHLFRLPLSGRAYVDLVAWDRWVVASPRDGPWTLVRGPLSAAGPTNPGSARTSGVSSRGRLELPPGVGPPGVAVVDATGEVRLLRPPPWTRGNGDGRAR